MSKIGILMENGSTKIEENRQNEQRRHLTIILEFFFLKINHFGRFYPTAISWIMNKCNEKWMKTKWCCGRRTALTRKNDLWHWFFKPKKLSRQHGIIVMTAKQNATISKSKTNLCWPCDLENPNFKWLQCNVKKAIKSALRVGDMKNWKTWAWLW